MNKFKGVFTATITPFKSQKIDDESFLRLLKSQMDQGVDGFVINGTTGESPCLSEEEVKKLFSMTRKEVGSHFPLLLGTGSNCTTKAVEMTKKAEEWGADGALVVVPYYNKPPQEGLYEHFKTVASSVSIPIFLYNVPSRTVVSLDEDTIAQLSEEKNIVGIKEATGNISFFQRIKEKVKRDFIYLSGDDNSLYEFSSHGGHGVISVISHILPKETKEVILHGQKKENLPKGLEERFSFYNDLLGRYTNPIAIKILLFLKGLIDSPEVRLPLTVKTSFVETLKAHLKKRGEI
ncbi:MAG: 4-hydroxy-tetrahydrodipicolinate synthase [Bdellovibrio sp.]|nr:MAG: 4-hydroxy-tetrahydrodipicolinate synthase [Bdellovibrio sp.]